jgi:hypothetical protein
MLNHVRDLLSHCAWADAVFFHVWGKGDREDKEVRERVAHGSGTQELFIQTLRGDEPLPWAKILSGEVKPPWADRPLPTFDALKDWTRGNHECLRGVVEALDHAGLSRMVTIPWIGEPPCVITMADALTQVAMHTQHHRGQNITRLRQLGTPPKNVDYILWLWKGKPAASWT